MESVAVNDWSAWYVSGGLIFAQTGLSSEQISSETIKIVCPRAITKVCCFDTVSVINKKLSNW